MRAISAPVEAEKVDRSAGFLTATERKYLLGEWAPGDSEPGRWTQQQEASKRSDIKTRTRHAIADIALLQQYGDEKLLTEVIERARNPDDIPTFYDNTLSHAKQGISQFLIRLALGGERADDLIDVLDGEDWDELLEDMSAAAEESKQVAQEHEHFAEPATEQLRDYAEANNITKQEMLDAIDYHWEQSE
jgi:hypothetical protein